MDKRASESVSAAKTSNLLGARTKLQSLKAQANFACNPLGRVDAHLDARGDFKAAQRGRRVCLLLNIKPFATTATYSMHKATNNRLNSTDCQESGAFSLPLQIEATQAAVRLLLLSFISCSQSFSNLGGQKGGTQSGRESSSWEAARLSGCQTELTVPVLARKHGTPSLHSYGLIDGYLQCGTFSLKANTSKPKPAYLEGNRLVNASARRRRRRCGGGGDRRRVEWR